MWWLTRGSGTLMLASFLVVAVLQAWPLPLYLATTLTGSPSSDAGVYVWNEWVFRHEVVANHRLPISTLTVLPLDGLTDLSLHNFTVFSDLLALPLQPVLGVVATFNVVYLFNVALAGFGMYLLARRITGRWAESWLAGLLFACSPYLVTRGNIHFSLAAAAPLPIFVCALERFRQTRRVRDAVGAGTCVAWAAYCDPYYAVYCLMIGGCMLVSRVLTLRTSPEAAARLGRARRSIDLGILLLVGLMLWMRLIGGGSAQIGPIAISLHSLYTPMLLLTTLVVVRLCLTFRPRVEWQQPLPKMSTLLRAMAAGAVATTILLAPQLYAVGRLVATGRLTRAPVGWRSSADGADLVSFLIPNPNHPWAPHAWAAWLGSRPGGFADQVASVSFVALAVIAFAWWRAGVRPSRFWIAITCFFASLTLGPFVHVAGITTFVPTPWTLLRYVPIIGDARMPSRFDAVVMVGLSALFAGGLSAITARYPARRRAILAVTGLLLVVELLPAPRHLYATTTPAVYRTIAADPRPVRVLDLPFGIRDGLSSFGNYNASDQFFQTVHGKPVIGGYLSRLSQFDKDYYRQVPVLEALMSLSAGQALDPDLDRRARQSARAFVVDADIGYVVIDEALTSPALRRFAVDLFSLVKVEEGDGYELFVPRGRGAARSIPGKGRPCRRRRAQRGRRAGESFRVSRGLRMTEPVERSSGRLRFVAVETAVRLRLGLSASQPPVAADGVAVSLG